MSHWQLSSLFQREGTVKYAPCFKEILKELNFDIRFRSLRAEDFLCNL